MSFIWVRHGPIVLKLHSLSSSTAQLEHIEERRRAYILYTQPNIHHHHVGHITCSLPRLKTAKPQSPIWVIHATAACQAVERTLISISRAPD